MIYIPIWAESMFEADHKYAIKYLTVKIMVTFWLVKYLVYFELFHDTTLYRLDIPAVQSSPPRHSQLER